MRDVNNPSDSGAYKIFTWFLKFLAVIAIGAFALGAVAVVVALAYRYAGILLMIAGFVWLCVWADKRVPKDSDTGGS